MRLVGTNIHYVPSNEVQVPTEEATGRGLKRILPIVVSFIVPVAAPWLAAKVGLSSALSGAISGIAGKAIGGIAGRAIGSALTGAAIGAVTGTGAGAGALGGLFGGLTGMGGTGSAKTNLVPPSAVRAAPGTVGVKPGAPSSAGGAGVIRGKPSVIVDFAPGKPGQYAPGSEDVLAARAGKAPGAPRPIHTGASNAPLDIKMASSGLPKNATQLSEFEKLYQPTKIKPEPTGPAEASLGDRFQTAVGQAGSRVMKTLTDPDTILRAGMFLATGAISGSPEEQALIKEQAEALRELRERDSQAFNMRMELARQAVGEASFYDPLAVANWAAAQARTSASAAAQQAERESMARGSRNTGRDEAIRRAGLLNVAARGSQAFAEGYGRGVGARQSGIAAAAGMVPSGGPMGSFEAAALLGAERERAERAARDEAAGIGSLFAGLTGAPRWT